MRICCYYYTSSSFQTWQMQKQRQRLQHLSPKHQPWVLSKPSTLWASSKPLPALRLVPSLGLGTACRCYARSMRAAVGSEGWQSLWDAHGPHTTLHSAVTPSSRTLCSLISSLHLWFSHWDTLLQLHLLKNPSVREHPFQLQLLKGASQNWGTAIHHASDKQTALNHTATPRVEDSRLDTFSALSRISLMCSWKSQGGFSVTWTKRLSGGLYFPLFKLYLPFYLCVLTLGAKGFCAVSGWGTTWYGLVGCGSNGNGRMVGLHDLVGPFQPYDSMILWRASPIARNGTQSPFSPQSLDTSGSELTWSLP